MATFAAMKVRDALRSLEEDGGKVMRTRGSHRILDHPGCVSIGDTLEAVQGNVKEAIELHLEVLQERGEPIPEPRRVTGKITIAA